MNVKICGNEIIFPVSEPCDEKLLYDNVAEILQKIANIRIGGNLGGPWCNFRTCSLNGKEFKIVHDLDDDETYITSEDHFVLETLRNKLMEA